MTNDGLHTYAWDADGKSITMDTVTASYDALGRMVEENKAGTYTQLVYSPTGQRLAYMNGSSLTKAYVPLPGGGVAIYNSAGLNNYHHMDWLGSFRLGSSPTRSVIANIAYAPFGETYAVTGTAVNAFTGMTQDSDSNLYDFPAREYGIQGRWPSPDPAGLAAVDPTNPQSWNRYAYVGNAPCELIDPTGLTPVCTFNINVAVSEDAQLTLDDLITALTRVDAIFAQGTDANGNSVNVNFTLGHNKADYNLNFQNAPFWAEADLGGKTWFPGLGRTSSVFVDHLKTDAGLVQPVFLGSVAAHELIHHAILGNPFDNDDPKNIGNDPNSGPVSRNSNALTEGQIGDLVRKCQKLHPKKKGTGGSGGIGQALGAGGDWLFNAWWQWFLDQPKEVVTHTIGW